MKDKNRFVVYVTATHEFYLKHGEGTTPEFCLAHRFTRKQALSYLGNQNGILRAFEVYESNVCPTCGR